MVIEKNNINSTFKVKKQLKASPKSPLGWRFLIDNNQLGNVNFCCLLSGFNLVLSQVPSWLS